MTRLVRQRGPLDCSIAAIAMATGKPYRVVLDAAEGYFDPDRGTSELSPILLRLGLSDRWEFGQPVGDFLVWHLPWGISPDVFNRAIWGRRALVSVPSLNNPAGWHTIYWTGRKVMDPNPVSKRRYRDLAQLQPTEIIIFQETEK